ncbi:AraC family transcriptional regulator [Chitinophaga lutea]|uniref:AraC family transcriptional regulator n=1 Tax=Chitinophaga lutea TaxID=2488634 RepID=A0A3N4PZX5_9BACT|nr:AraC family transcriptional regulator [Chitinophaga lutea]RPE09250.1 AraC family transcriptional regulator [Chitinophaga lutea]
MQATGTFYEAPAALSSAIQHFYHIKGVADEVAHLAPNFDMLLVFNFGAPMPFAFADEFPSNQVVVKTAVLGPLKKMFNYRLTAESDTLAVVFVLDGFYRLFQATPDETDAAKLAESEGLQELWQTLKDTPHTEDRVMLLGEYLQSMLRAPEEGAIPLVNGLPYFDNPLVQPAKAIAQDTGVSERTVQTRFRKYTGYSAKEVLRFIRFKQVLHRIREQVANGTRDIDWMDMVHDFGYHDQSHLIKDFRFYMGMAPEHFMKEIRENGFCVSRPGKYY